VVLAVALLVGGVGYLTLAWYVWQRRQTPAATALLFSVLGIALWTSAYAIEMTTRTFGTAAVWSTVKYLGIVTVPGSLFAFALDYTARRRRVTRRTAALLAIEPTLVMIVLSTPPIRELMLAYEADAFEHTKWPVPSEQPLFYVHLVYSYSVLVFALTLSATRMIRLGRPYRRPAVLVAITSLVALAGNAYYNLEYPAWTVDPTPLLFTLLMGVLVWGLFRMGMIDLAPIARGTVIEQLTDAVLVLDAYNRVVDANPAAAGLFRLPRGRLIGRVASELLPPATDLLQTHLPGAARQIDIPTTADSLGRSGPAPVHLEVNISSVLDRGGREAGRVMLLRDVTRRIETEQRLRDMLEAETHLAAVLQTSLRPASLPSVPRVQLAARSLPAGHGSQVSGDFYDVHQALGGDWAMVLGDVAGKGVHAAVVTSMARYTVRALSAQGWSPKQVAEQLNQALLVDTGPERFCTMVYARIGEREPVVGDPGGGQPASAESTCGQPEGVRLTLALSGHPPPLLRRLDGSIEAVGRPGTALGIVTLPEIEETVVDLLPGEVLLAYTDGVTEARRDRAEFGEERLAWILATAASGLRGRTGVAAASLVANAVADRVMDAVTEYAPTRDDIAVLVLAVA
jgi:PAS domain S-box-containing protein